MEGGLNETNQAILDKSVLEFSIRERNLLMNKQKAKQKRLDGKLKTNLITTQELLFIIEDWLSRGRSNLKTSFTTIYNTTDHINKEFDWVKATLNATHFSNELNRAFHLSKHPSVMLLKSSSIFDSKSFGYGGTLSKRIISMNVELLYEEALIQKDLEIANLKEALKEASTLNTWESRAAKLLNEGKTQREVSSLVGKSLATIKRLVKNLKED